METVFDYNMTDEEKKFLGFDGEGIKETYLRYAGENSVNLGLAELFWYRGDKKKAEEYAEKLPPILKWDFWREVTHP